MENEPARLDGYLLDGRYRLEAPIGRGGMGQVYRARHLLMDQRVAVKILKPDLAEDPDATTRFVREAKTTFRLDHPGCVRVTDMGAADGLVYLVMEYLDGRTVGQELGYDGPIQARRVLHIATQVCRALHAAHAMGLVHRDLKPDNLMLVHRGDDPDVVKVLDFGLAKVISDRPAAFATAFSLTPLTRQGLIFGTPEYMSPEQALDDTLTPASDLYALGVVLYEMLTGALPFHGANPMEILAAHVDEAPVPPRTRRPDLAIPPPLSDLVVQLLAKVPADRPASAAALAGELERMAAHPSFDPAPRVAWHVASSSTIDLSQSAIARAASDPSIQIVHPHATAASDAPTMPGLESPPNPRAEPEPKPRPRSPARIWLLGVALGAAGLVILAVFALAARDPEPVPASPSATATPAATTPAPVTAHHQPPAIVAPSTIAAPDATSAAADAAPAPSTADAAPASAATPPADRPDGDKLSRDQRQALDEHLRRAQSARQAGAVLEQMAHADSALRIDRDNPQAAYLLGDALIESDPSRACRYLAKARRRVRQARAAYREAGCDRSD